MDLCTWIVCYCNSEAVKIQSKIGVKSKKKKSLLKWLYNSSTQIKYTHVMRTELFPWNLNAHIDKKLSLYEGACGGLQMLKVSAKFHLRCFCVCRTDTVGNKLLSREKPLVKTEIWHFLCFRGDLRKHRQLFSNPQGQTGWLSLHLCTLEINKWQSRCKLYHWGDKKDKINLITSFFFLLFSPQV